MPPESCHGILVALTLEADLGEQRLGSGDVLGPVAAQPRAVRLDDLERQQQVLERRAPGQQRRVLERHPGELHRRADLPARRRSRVPARGNCRPVASFIRVDLPQPDGPTMAANSPSRTVQRESLTAGAPSSAPA